jgi:hypothetical protein
LHRLHGRVTLTYDAPSDVRRLGQYPTWDQIRYQQVSIFGTRDGEGRPQLTYLFEDGHIYINQLGSGALLESPGTGWTLYAPSNSSASGTSGQDFSALMKSHAIVLAPLY